MTTPTLQIALRGRRRRRGVAALSVVGLDGDLTDLHTADQQTARAFRLLAGFAAVQRRKEIGVRKALGASVASLIALLSREIVAVVAVAFLVAAPLAALAMQRWLDRFVYRVEIAPGLLVAGATLALALAATAAFPVRAATAGPVRALRTD